MGKALAENSTLQFLDLSSNRVGLKGAIALADGLRENQTLRSLQINGNPIGDEGATKIIDAVGVNCSVRDLGLQDCLGKEVGSKTGGSRAGCLFDPLNPTGHYVLNLADPFDVEILERLKLLDRMDEVRARVRARVRVRVS